MNRRVYITVLILAAILLALVWALNNNSSINVSNGIGSDESQARQDSLSLPTNAVSRETNAAPQREPYKAPPVNNPALSNFVNRKSPRVRVPPDMVALFPSVSDPIDQEAVANVLLDVFDDDSIRNEAAELLARSNYTRLLDRLEEVLNNPYESERFRGWAVQHIGTHARSHSGPDNIRGVALLRSCLLDSALPVRREALLALVRMDDPVGIQYAADIVQSDDPANATIQDIALQCIGLVNKRAQLPHVRKLIRSSNVDVQIAAINLLADWRDLESKSDIQNYVDSKSYILRTVAQRALERIELPAPAQNTLPGRKNTPITQF